MLPELLSDTLTVTPPADAVDHAAYVLPGRIEAVKTLNEYQRTAQVPGIDRATHVGYTPAVLTDDTGTVTRVVRIGLGAIVSSVVWGVTFYAASPGRPAMGRDVADHIELELREIGEFRDAVVVRRPSGGADSDGDPISTLTVVWTGYGQFESSSATSGAQGDTRTETLDAVLRVPLDADVRTGDRVTVRGHKWVCLNSIDALDHSRVSIRRVA